MAESLEIRRLRDLAEKVESGNCRPCLGALKVGVDPGTANIALVVVDEENNPVAGISHPSRAVKDGVVVDFLTASRVVSGLKATLEERLNRTLTHAATAIPPGIIPGNTKTIVNMVEAAGFEVTEVVDEPVAAARALNIRDGAIVDVGGGTTGISILRDGDSIFSADEPTGGNHMTLVLSGALGISFAEAEEMKKAPEHEERVFALVRPVAEKMAHLVTGWLAQYPVDVIYLVGGASSFHQFADVFRKTTGKRVIQATHPLLVTPLGIAMHSH
ncbi:ethanolamine utilization protein EutJ [Klebsiella sp. WOUb02]|uniref:ethanolamine utilization protein EutJ n=1 Tax=Klebsiella sp. WOUb02 TaxID=3161071 RepID=UPI003CE6C617